MTTLLTCVAAYALQHAAWWAVDAYRGTYPRQFNPVLYALGIWSAYLLLAA